MCPMKKQMILRGLQAAVPHLAMTSIAERESWNTSEPQKQKDRWICYAILDGQEAGLCTKSEEAAARTHVMGMLPENCGTVDQYLKNHLKVDPKLLTEDNVQAFRKRWLEHMIQEFSK